MFSKILVGLDNSDDARRAVKKAMKLQKKFDSKVVIFHSLQHRILDRLQPLTVPMVNGPSVAPIAVSAADVRRLNEKKGRKLLEDVKKEFELELLPVETRLITDVDPEDYIERTVQDEGFDLVIIGCKGEHSKVKRIFGTVAEKVLNRAPCDVMVVR